MRIDEGPGEDSNSGAGRSSGPDPNVSRNRILVLVLGALAIGMPLAALLVVRSWEPLLPDPVAIHFGAGGMADGYASFPEFVWIFGASAIVFLVPALVAAFFSSKRVDLARILTGTALYLGALFATLLLYTTWIQKGLADASDAYLSGEAVVAVIVLPIVPAVLGALLLRTPLTPDAASRPPSSAPTVPLVDGKVPTWEGETTSPAWLSAVVGLLLVVPVLALAVAFKTVLLVPVALVLGAATFGLFGARIVVDAEGLTVAARFGWPKKTILATQVEEATVVEVHPLQEFGGWGYRIGFGGAAGIVMRSGPGISVLYGNGETLVVTVNEGASLAAATLNTAALAARS